MKNIGLKSFLLPALFLSYNILSAQGYYRPDNAVQEKSRFKWPEGKVMAISLTFDDARLSQIDKGIPLLDRYGVKGTFYVSLRSVEKRLDGWKAAVRKGHDIGNHSLLHTCSVNLGSSGGGLENYTLTRMKTELDSAGKALKNILGVNTVSFGYPCGQTFIGRGIDTQSYVPLIAMMFESGRGWLDEAPNDPVNCDMAQLTGMKLDQLTFEQVRPLIESAKKSGKWLILAGHEMNDSGTGLTTFLSTIEAICEYASDPANGIWIDNVHNIASYVIRERAKMSAVK
jgi:peptidoglycan/xylan/chitin deacetylase (PgdA/CDA1 family)